MADLSDLGNCSWAAAARHAGFASGIAFPVGAAGRLVAAVDFVLDRPVELSD